MKVVLIGYNVQGDVFPLGLNYLKSFAKKSNPDVEFILKEFNIGNRVSSATNKSIEMQTLAYLLELKPNLVGFSSYIWSVDIISSVCKMIREVMPEVKILIGGVEVTNSCLEYSDFIIEGEGELAFSSLVKTINLNGNYSLVPGIVYLVDGIIKFNDKKLLENLDLIPFPYSKSNGGVYPSMRIETSRGCPFNCKYCYYANCKKPRYFSIDYLDTNLDTLFSNFDFKYLTLLDANINLNFTRMKEVLDLILKKAKRHSRKFVLNFELKPELITPEIIKYLNKYSLDVRAELGLQSTDSEVLKKCNRPYDLEKVKIGLSLLDNSNVKYKIDLMYGLPRDNFFKFLSSCRFVLKYAKSQKQIPAHHFMLLNNTEFTNNSDIVRMDKTHSSMVVKTKEQSPLDIYKTKLFIDTLNEELKLS